ncbi:protein of unknown function [Rhodovastum atsumiense]|nr:protein of unknown function [Rhodovastum atsumiense]
MTRNKGKARASPLTQQGSGDPCTPIRAARQRMGSKGLWPLVEVQEAKPPGGVRGNAPPLLHANACQGCISGGGQSGRHATSRIASAQGAV